MILAPLATRAYVFARVAPDTSVGAEIRLRPMERVAVKRSPCLSLSYAKRLRVRSSWQPHCDAACVKLLHKQIAIAPLAFASLAPRPAGAQVERAVLDKTLSPYFFIENGDPALDQLPLKQTRVEVEISGVIADVIVRQYTRTEGSGPSMSSTSSRRRPAPPSTA